MKSFFLLSLIYGLITLVRNLLFDLGVLRVRRLPVKVVSVGNITAGGTGKTPLVIYLGERLKARGARFGVLSRGYGRASLRPFVISSVQGVSAAEIGDEPRMIGGKLGCFLGVGANRVKIGSLLLRKYGPMPLILDDGFSHRYLHRDLDLITLNGDDPFSRGLLPYGLRREPLRGLRRAHALILTRSAPALPDYAPIRDRLLKLDVRAPVFTAYRRAEGILAPDRPELDMAAARGRPYYLFSGIAGGEQFVKLARESGVEVTGRTLYPDHFRFDRAEIDHLRQNAGAAPLLTTEKDLSRLGELASGVHALRISLVFDEEKGFGDLLSAAFS